MFDVFAGAGVRAPCTCTTFLLLHAGAAICGCSCGGLIHGQLLEGTLLGGQLMNFSFTSRSSAPKGYVHSARRRSLASHCLSLGSHCLGKLSILMAIMNCTT